MGLSGSIRDYARVLLHWRSAVTCLLSLGGLCVYDRIPWGFLQLLISDIVANILRVSDHIVLE